MLPEYASRDNLTRNHLAMILLYSTLMAIFWTLFTSSIKMTSFDRAFDVIADNAATAGPFFLGLLKNILPILVTVILSAYLAILATAPISNLTSLDASTRNLMSAIGRTASGITITLFILSAPGGLQSNEHLAETIAFGVLSATIAILGAKTSTFYVGNPKQRYDFAKISADSARERMTQLPTATNDKSSKAILGIVGNYILIALISLYVILLAYPSTDKAVLFALSACYGTLGTLPLFLRLSTLIYTNSTRSRQRRTWAEAGFLLLVTATIISISTKLPLLGIAGIFSILTGLISLYLPWERILPKFAWLTLRGVVATIAFKNVLGQQVSAENRAERAQRDIARFETDKISRATRLGHMTALRNERPLPQERSRRRQNSRGLTRRSR